MHLRPRKVQEYQASNNQANDAPENITHQKTDGIAYAISGKDEDRQPPSPLVPFEQTDISN